ncbi:MAG: YihY/virulence factor BrkB family protein [Clostridia bacterium]|nr:YihY/virulence factor BrkB family protein [Clostridia bacterium]
MPKAHVWHFPFVRELVRTVRRFRNRLRQDRITVYAAQASFFTIISTVPLASLIAGTVRLFWPSAAGRGKAIDFFTGTVPASMLELAVHLFDEVSSASVPVLSVSAAFVWWSAAKGVGAIREGIQTVYEAPRIYGYLRKMCSSIVYTAVFVILIAATVAVLLCGEFLLELAEVHLSPFTDIFRSLLAYKTPLFLIFLTLVFSLLYYAVSRRSTEFASPFRYHIPGALCASLGWLGFSWIYSFYMNHASRPYLLYGDLTATCFILLWLYFCMIILLCGAEINKMFFAKTG